MKFRYFLPVLFLIMLTSCRSQSTIVLDTPTPDPSSAIVDAAYPIGDVSPAIFGVNHGPWAFVTSDLFPLAVDVGFGFIRFPGGNWGDLNTMTAREVQSVADLAEAVGAELSISVRLSGGTPEQAADLVRMANEELGLNVRYWSIGNEPALYEGYDTVRYNYEWRAIAEAMREVDPDILLIGPEVTQFTGNPGTDPKDENGLFWIDEFLRHNGDMVDIVSIHRYPFPVSMDADAVTAEELYASAEEWETIIPALRSRILEITGEEKPIAVTEVNSHWTNAAGLEASPDSFANAIWWTDVLTRMIRKDVEIVTFFSLQSNVNIGGYGLFGRYDTRPTFFVYEVFRYFGETLIYSNPHDEGISIAASQCSDGDVTVVLVNASLDDRAMPLRVLGVENMPNTIALLLAEDIWAEEFPVEEFYDGEVVRLSAESVLALTYSEDLVNCNSAGE